MEIWTASHITNINRFNNLIHCVNSVKENFSSEQVEFVHRISVSYLQELSIPVQRFIEDLKGTTTIVYDHGTSKKSHFAHLDHILTQVNLRNQETMIMFLDGNDLLLNYPRNHDMHDVIIGNQLLPILHASVNMRRYCTFTQETEPPTEVMIKLQETGDLERIKSLLDMQMITTTTIKDLSGYGAKLRIITEIFNHVNEAEQIPIVQDKKRTELPFTTIDLDIITMIETHPNKLDNRNLPHVYRRLMRYANQEDADWGDE